MIWKQIKQILVLTLAHCLVDISTVKTNTCLEVSFSFAKAFEFNSTRKKSLADADFLGELHSTRNIWIDFGRNSMPFSVKNKHHKFGLVLEIDARFCAKAKQLKPKILYIVIIFFKTVVKN